MADRRPSLIRLKQIEVMKIITPGSAAQSLLIERITGKDMPPTGAPLSDKDIATITAWADDPTPTTPHEAAMAQCMTALAGINNQLTERLANA